ncbi:unnamed protein product [Prorocentrum cordatum]|uniref:DNA (cytosine-5-)-methyltransferase n=1 Tax=Prorocentrum cordatum TaxID=2364126 RepID=A0ABN9SVF9_9DINO|nr:unnamed protein product [Polarella glacialis]
MRDSFRGHAPEQASRRDVPLAGHFKGRYLLDLYAGTGGVARAVAQQGCNAHAYVRTHGLAEDMTCLKVLGRLDSAVSLGEVPGAALGPPCDASGAAADRGPHGSIQTVRAPWGSPEAQLATRQRVRLRRGTKISDVLCVFSAPCVVTEFRPFSSIPYIPEFDTLLSF